MSTATVVAPRSIEEAAEAVRHAARERAVVLATGGNTKRTWTKPAARVDIELSTRRLSGVVVYEPGDGVITALAGTPWAELEALVARNGHHLSPAIPAPSNVTVGGVVAAGQSGMDRLRFGPLRDHVLGLRVVMADGTTAKTGGRLVKNVTGFDLQRLHTGAHGTLGLVAEVSLRLHAAPGLRAVGLAFHPTRESALEMARAVTRLSRAAWAVLVTDFTRDSESKWMVNALLGGGTAVVESEVSSLQAALPALPWIVARPGTRDEAQVPLTWNASFGNEYPGGWRTVRITCKPTALNRTLFALDRSGIETRIAANPALGIVDASIRPLDRGVVERISADLARVGARVHWRGLEDELRARVDLFGPDEPAGIALMRRIRANLDPNGLWATGRLAGGL
ncbi:MAG: FAD-binding oxidoreductase [Planctomycetota bacterium]|nr:FAD-binding oxidoreductase [Planctomycetota bacterium]